MQKLRLRWAHLVIALIWAILWLLWAEVSPLQAVPDFQGGVKEDPPSPAEGEVIQLTNLGPYFPSNLPEGYPRFVWEPVWSPQGHFVVFSSNYNTPISSYWASDGLFILDLYAVAVDGSGRMSRITETGDHLGLGFLSPAFLYPTGAELLVCEFVNLGEFMRMDLNQAPIRRTPPLDGNASGLIQLLQGEGGQIASSKDGRLIAWEHRHPQDTSIRQVRVAPLAELRGQSTGDVGTVVFRMGVEGSVYGLSFSPDGSKLAIGCRYQKGDPYDDIFIVDTSGAGAPRRLLGEDFLNCSNYYPDWSSDDRIAFASTRDGTANLYVVNPDGSNALQVTYQGGSDPSWSPDGSRLAFISLRSGSPEVWVITAPPRPSSLIIKPVPEIEGPTSIPYPLPSTPTPITCTPDAAFVADVTVPDGTVFAPGARIDKVWRLRNSGDCPWVSGYQLTFVSGDQMGAADAQAVPPTTPGATADISVTMHAPQRDGTYTGFWQMQDPSGQLFGPRVRVVIVIQTVTMPSPAGERIAFSSNRDGNDEVYVMNIDGSRQTRLTDNPATDWGPAWSPDGGRIAFSSNRDGNDEIYVMNAEGSGQTNLTNNPAGDWHPAWSPDGKHIAFMSNRDGNNEIYVMSANGSGQSNLTNDPADDWHPAWSPDGGHIAFMSDRDGNNEIYAMNADGSGLTRLTNNLAGDFRPAWSPDGGRIAFSSNRDGNMEIYVMNADGSGLSRLTDNPAWDGLPAWSPDGQRIVFTSDRDGNDEIYIMNVDGSGLTRLTNNPADDQEACLVAVGPWSYTVTPTPVSATLPQYGDKIAFKSDRDGGESLYIMNPDGTDQRRLDDESLYRQETERQWVSADGRYKLTVMDNRGNWDVYLDDGQNPPSFITTNDADDYDPAWSPAGDRIAFVSSRIGRADIWLMDPTGRNEVPLTHGEGMNKYPTWSPDGSRIAFWSDRQEGRRQIWIINADGSNLHNISNNVYNDWDPVWIKH